MVKLAIRMGCLVHREQFNVWFLDDIKYSWLDKIAYHLPFITNKTERITFKSECVKWVAKHLKKDWFIVLHQQLWNFASLLKV